MTARTSRGSKRKGREYQNELLQLLLDSVPINPVDVHTTPMGQAGCDIFLGAETREIWPFGIEAKRQETTNIWAWLEQCEMNARKEGLRPLLVFRRNRGCNYAAMPLDTFLGIWNEVLALRKKVGCPNAKEKKGGKR